MSNNDIVPAQKTDEGELEPADEPYTINGVTIHPDGTVESESVDTDRLTNAGVEWVTPEDDLQSVYDNATGPVFFTGVHEPTSTLEVRPSKPLISWLPSPGDSGKAGRLKNTNNVDPMIHITGTGTNIESNHPAMRGVFLDGDSQQSRGLRIDDSNQMTRNSHIDQCLFRYFDDFAIDVNGARGPRFSDCYVEDSNFNAGTRAINITSVKYFEFNRCQFVDGGATLMRLNSFSRVCRIHNCRFANAEGAFLNINDGGGGGNETALIITNNNFSFFPQAVNGISLTDAAVEGPLIIANNHFDGINRNDGTATGNKAVNVTERFSEPFVFENNTAVNFTNAPWFALRDALADAQVGGNDPRPAWASNSISPGGAGTGVQKNSVDGAIPVEGARTPEVVARVDETTTPDADFGYRVLEPTVNWDDSQGAYDVTFRVEVTNDPGTTWTINYDIVPPAK